MRDTNQRYLTEAKLLLSLSSELVYKYDFIENRFIYISPNVKQILGYDAEDFLQREWQQIIVKEGDIYNNKEKASCFADLIKKRIEGDYSEWNAEYLIANKDNGYMWLKDQSMVRLEDNQPVIIGKLSSIDEIKKLQEQNKDLFQQLSGIDNLTQTFNREKFFTILEHEINRINRTFENLSLILIDISNYFDYSNYYDNDLVNNSLFNFAKIIKRNIRNIDVLARLNKSEFAIILPYTDKKQSEFLIKRLKDVIEKHQINNNLSDKNNYNIEFTFASSSIAAGQKLTAAELYKNANLSLFIANNSVYQEMIAGDISNIKIH